MFPLQAVTESNRWIHPLPRCSAMGEGTLSTSQWLSAFVTHPTLHCSPQSSSMDSTRTALLLSSVAVVALLPLWWAPGTFLALTSLLAAAAAIVCVWRCMRRRAVERGVSQVVSYVEGFDSLLCLVAESIRYLQEMEALSKGYARSV